jgi:hypothetical protein
MADDLRVRVEVPELTDIHQAIELSGDLRVFPRFTAHATGGLLPFDVSLDAEFEDRRFRVQRLEAVKRTGGEDVTNHALRQIPVARIMQQAVEQIVVQGEWSRSKDQRELFADWGPGGLPDLTLSRGPDQRNLETVAAVYRLAYVVNIPPTEFVRQRLGLPKSTAGRWVRLARDAGLLGEAVGTRAGEA